MSDPDQKLAHAAVPLGHPARAAGLYDMRNLFQVNVEEGRHLWAMVDLPVKHFGKDGCEEAQALLPGEYEYVKIA